MLDRKRIFEGIENVAWRFLIKDGKDEVELDKTEETEKMIEDVLVINEKGRTIRLQLAAFKNKIPKQVKRPQVPVTNFPDN